MGLDEQLRAAFLSADVSHSGDLSKRELYAALDKVGLALTPSEALGVWRNFDRDKDGRVDWDDFRALGTALLEEARSAESSSHRSGGEQHTKRQRAGGFATRSRAEEARMHHAAVRIQKLARQRSLELAGEL